ncbi:MAG: cytochrome P460 family protein [Roseobacter sp.]
MTRKFALGAAFSMIAGAAFAQDCSQLDAEVEDFFDLDETHVVALYACLEQKMADGYAKGGDEVGSAFRTWAVTSTRPAAEGSHGNRLLQTFANDIAADQYLEFAEEGFVMPVGSVLAKESISFSKKKKTARPGPLFIMTKMELGSIPETDDWLYSGVQPNGKVMKVKQSFCHDCHTAWGDRDSLAYPLEEVRIGASN